MRSSQSHGVRCAISAADSETGSVVLPPLYEFQCEDCGVFEARASVSDASLPRTCSCGREAKRQFSSINLKVRQLGWTDIAPMDEYGKPMTMKEAAKAGLVESRDTLPSRDAEREEQATTVAKAQAKRDAWREVSADRRIVI